MFTKQQSKRHGKEKKNEKLIKKKEKGWKNLINKKLKEAERERGQIRKQ